MAHGLNIPQALDKFFLPQLRIDEFFNDLAKDPYYTSYLKGVGIDDAAGDQIYHVYTEPLAAIPEWKGPRHEAEIDTRYWTSTVRTFASSMSVDVDDIKADSGSPAKLAVYRMKAQRLVESAMLLWPDLFVKSIQAGSALTYSSAGLAAALKWLPDGQNIFDNHPINPSSPSGTAFRNYRSKDTTGGSAAFPISYANEKTVLAAGLAFKLPNGLERPIRYNKVFTNAANVPTLEKILKDDWIPSYEANSSNVGGSVPNEIRRHYGGEGIEVIGVANMPSALRLYMDTSMMTEMPLRLKERQPITWQYQGMSGAEGAFPVGNDEGAVSDSVFNTNSAKYGPKARGEVYAANWWRMFLCDSTP